ncbi:MAG: OsmC family protein [Alkalispirochaeta sp.]
MSNQDFSISLQRLPEADRSIARVRDFSLTIGSKAGDLSVGFNPVETLLAAAGACITTSLGLVAKNSDVTLDDVSVTATATRQADPPRVIAIHLTVHVASPADDQKIDRIFSIASKSSTVISTLREAMTVDINWSRAEHPVDQ